MEQKKDILKTVTRYAQAGEWQKVLVEYEKLLKLEPNDITLHNSIADAYVKLDAPKMAFSHYLIVLEDCQKKNDQKKLGFLYKKIAKLNPRKFDIEGKALHDKITRSVNAVTLYEKGDYENALPALKEAISYDKLNSELYTMLGDVCEKKTMVGEAVEAYVKALRIMIEKGGRHEEAILLAKKILNLDKSNTEAMAMAAEDMIKKGEKAQAEEMFKDILISLADKNAVAEGRELAKRIMDMKVDYGKQFYAYFLFKDNKTEEAKKVLEGGYDLTMEEKLLLGKIYFKSGDFQKAKDTMMSLAPEIISENHEVLDQIGDIFLKLKEYKPAAEHYMKAARLIHAEGGLDHALVMCNKVLNCDGENIEAREMLAGIFSKKGMKNNLIDVYTKLASLYDKAGRAEDSVRVKQMLAKLKLI